MTRRGATIEESYWNISQLRAWVGWRDLEKVGQWQHGEQIDGLRITWDRPTKTIYYDREITKALQLGKLKAFENGAIGRAVWATRTLPDSGNLVKFDSNQARAIWPAKPAEPVSLGMARRGPKAVEQERVLALMEADLEANAIRPDEKRSVLAARYNTSEATVGRVLSIRKSAG